MKRRAQRDDVLERGRHEKGIRLLMTDGQVITNPVQKIDRYEFTLNDGRTFKKTQCIGAFPKFFLQGRQFQPCVIAEDPQARPNSAAVYELAHYRNLHKEVLLKLANGMQLLGEILAISKWTFTLREEESGFIVNLYRHAVVDYTLAEEEGQTEQSISPGSPASDQSAE